MGSVVIPAVLLALLSSQETEEVQQHHWDWLSQHRFEAFDTLMPLEAESYVPVTFRSYRAFYQEVHEQYFQIAEPQRNSLQATVIAPIGQSIQQQMLDLHMRDPSASFESVLRQVQVSNVMVEERDCPALREQIETLESIHFTVPNPDRVIIHPAVYWISIDFSDGKVLAELTVEDHPLVRWANETQRKLDKCSSQGAR